MQQNSILNSSQFIDSSSTLNSLSQSTQDYQSCKIMGYLRQQQPGEDFFPLKSVLPVDQKLLIKMMINLIEMIFEVEQRAFPLPQITLDKIMLHKKNSQVGLVYIFAPNSESKCQENTVLQIKKLSFDRQIYQKPDNLQSIADNLWDLLFNIDVDPLRRKYIERFGSFTVYCMQMLGAQILGDPLYVNESIIAVYSSEKYSFIEPPENQKIAIKFAQDQQDGYKRREIEILEKFNSPYTSKLYCYMRFKNITVLVLKYHDKTFQEIQKKFVEISNTNDLQLLQKIFVHFFKLIVLSLQQLHDVQGIIHRDLKPENLMFDFTKPVKTIEDYFDAVCIIIDFDRSKDKQDKVQSCYQGTPDYVPPEGVLKEYSSSYDIYQVGMIFFLSTYQSREYSKCFKQYGQRPLSVDQYKELLNKISQCKQIVKVGDQLMNLIKTMISHNPKERPTIPEIIKALDQM